MILFLVAPRVSALAGCDTIAASIRPRTFDDLTDKEKIREACDIRATNIALQERESKFYNKFDRFIPEKRETIHSYYLRFAQLINDMNTIGMTMKKLYVNIKFVNNLQPKWSKIVTDVKLAKDMHESSFDHLYAYLRQHETSAIPQQQQFYTSLPQPNPYEVLVLQLSYDAPVVHLAPVVHQQSYQASVVHQQSPTVFPQLDSGLVVPLFLPTNDLIASLNKGMEFISTTFALRYPSTNNQLKTSSNPRNQATIQDGRVTVQNVIWQDNVLNQRGQRIPNVIAQALEAWLILDKEHLAFLADTGDRADASPDSQTLPTTAIFQTNDRDAFDLECDEAPSASAVLMAKLSVYDSDVLYEVPNYKTYQDNNVIDSILNNPFLLTIQILTLQVTALLFLMINRCNKKKEVVQDTTSFEQQDAMIMFVVEEMPHQVEKCNAVNQEQKTVNESLTIELERSKELNEGAWGFKHIRRAFENDVIPFVKSLRELFADFELDRKYFEIEKQELLIENERLLEHIISQHNMCTAMHYYDDLMKYAKMEQSYIDEYSRCVQLEAELLRKKGMVERAVYNELSNKWSRLEKRCISLEIKVQKSKESFQHDKPCNNQDAPEFPAFFEINYLKAQLQTKNTSISKLKEHIATLKGKSVSDCTAPVNNANVLDPGMFKLDLPPLSSKLRKNKEVHVDYLKQTKEHANTLRAIVEQARSLQPFDNALDYAYKFTT
ncbi:hypothetical protein Tco_0894198 [Tanacetum coccineum]|uniref:Uncharacterized protein n=1 Tax=Tanacetum coccineum TaxID=301880 RepID=A0ABQ5CB03_9ASTR